MMHMPLSEQQKERYSRQLKMPEIGPAGQEKLLSSRVLIIGAGGLGSAAAFYLAAAGVGTLGLADGDRVELSNLQRQILHGTDTLGAGKTESAEARLHVLNPDVRIETHPVSAGEDNIETLLAPYDFIVDCTDSLDTKLMISDACVRMKKAFCHGAAAHFFGQLITYVPGKGPCCRCFFRDLPDPDQAPKAGKLGVLGAVPGVIGCLQALEAVKYLTGAGDLLTGRLLRFDALSMEFVTIELLPDPDCPVCGGH